MIVLNETGINKAWQLKRKFDDANFREYALRDISKALGVGRWSGQGLISDVAVVADARDGGQYRDDYLLLVKTNKVVNGSTRHALTARLRGEDLIVRTAASGRWAEDIKRYAALQDYDQVIVLYSDAELPEKMPGMLNEKTA